MLDRHVIILNKTICKAALLRWVGRGGKAMKFNEYNIVAPQDSIYSQTFLKGHLREGQK